MTTLLGSTVEEKTRNLLGWRETPSCSFSTSASSSPSPRNHPYRKPSVPFRTRRTSGSSSVSSDYSDNSSPLSSASLSPSPFSTSSSSRDYRLFTTLRSILHDLPSDRSAYQRLLDSVTNVMDEKTRLDEVTIKLEMPSPTPSPCYKDDSFPSDLESVDVSAFASLVSAQNPFRF